jgi:hypothetical protein
MLFGLGIDGGNRPDLADGPALADHSAASVAARGGAAFDLGVLLGVGGILAGGSTGYE